MVWVKKWVGVLFRFFFWDFLIWRYWNWGVGREFFKGGRIGVIGRGFFWLFFIYFFDIFGKS